MLKDGIRFLLCPVCRSNLAVRGKTAVCPNEHSFDVARQGYVNLTATASRKEHADTSMMAAARNSFLSAGHYGGLAGALASLAKDIVGGNPFDGCVVDVGGGTGYYLSHVLNVLPSAPGIALDRSKYASGYAARAHPRMTAIVADVWEPLPVQDGAAALVLNVFAPRNGPELRRITHREGALVVVVPNQDHLNELVDTLGLLRVDDRKEERLAEQLDPYFELRTDEHLKFTLRLDGNAIELLVAMGPNARHTEVGGLRSQIEKLPKPVSVTASVSIKTYSPKNFLHPNAGKGIRNALKY